MAVLDRTHPVVARFKGRGQAIALLKRLLGRALTEAEKQLFAGNPLLSGLTPDSPSAQRQAVLEQLEKDQTADDAIIAKEADEKRAKLAAVEEIKLLDEVEAKFATVSDADLEAARAATQATLETAQEAAYEVMAEVQRRARIAELLKKIGATTDTDKALLHRVLLMSGAASSAKVGAPGT